MARYETRITGNTQYDTFPYTVWDTELDKPVNAYTHMQVADEVALTLNGAAWAGSIYDVSEAQEQLPELPPD